jgi:uncharacterized membrane protein
MNKGPDNQSEAQREADRIRILRDELDRLACEGVLELTPEQRGRFDAWSSTQLGELSAKFDVDTTLSEKRVSWGMRIASTLGGLALCAALVLFFNHFWGEFGTSAQVMVVIAAPFIALAGTEFAARRERTLYFAGLMALLTLAAFVLNLAVIGRVFNVTSTENALLAWSALGLALAYRYGLRLLLFLGLGLLLTYVAAAFTARFGHHWLEFDDRPEHFGAMGLVLFAFPLVVRHARHGDFPPVYRLAGALSYFIAVLALCEWGAHSYLPFDKDTIEMAYELVGLATAAGAIWLGIARQWDGVVNTGSLFFVIFLFCRLYHWWWHSMPNYLFFAVIGAIAIVLVVAFKRVRAGLKSGAAA